MCSGMYTKIVEDIVTERKLIHFLTLTGVPGIASLIVSLVLECRRLCHLRSKQKVAPIAVVDVSVCK